MKMSKKSKVILYILLTIVAVYFLAPFVYMLLTTFKTEGEAIAYPPSLFPKDWHFENYAEAWSSQPFGTYFLNSVLVTVLTTAGTILSSSLVAYGFARFRFRGKNILFMILLATMMIPWDVTMIPQYMEFNLFGWINTLLPLIVPTWFGSAYYVFLMRQFYISIPDELCEAARIDGLNEFGIFSKIIFPLGKPGMATLTIFTFTNVWNDFMGPLIYLKTQELKTVQLGIRMFISQYGADYAWIMAASVCSLIPVVIVFLSCQRFFVEGVAASGIKG